MTEMDWPNQVWCWLMDLLLSPAVPQRESWRTVVEFGFNVFRVCRGLIGMWNHQWFNQCENYMVDLGFMLGCQDMIYMGLPGGLKAGFTSRWEIEDFMSKHKRARCITLTQAPFSGANLMDQTWKL